MTPRALARGSSQQLVFLEHLAVKSEHRKKGIGSELLRSAQQTELPVVLEVEPPKTEFQAKRIRLYRGLGFRLNQQFYEQPAYDSRKSRVRLFLMSYPGLITDFEVTRDHIYKNVYGGKL